jgi:hypothetical protein
VLAPLLEAAFVRAELRLLGGRTNPNEVEELDRVAGPDPAFVIFRDVGGDLVDDRFSMCGKSVANMMRSTPTCWRSSTATRSYCTLKYT